MSEIKFSCPICAQHISCDAQCAGMQIQCPACEKEIQIPVPASAPAPPPPSARPLKVSLPTAATHSAPSVAPPPPAAPQIPFRPTLPAMTADAPSGTGKRVAVWAAVIVVGGAALYGALTWASSTQKKFNVEREKNAAESDGGQLGHIAELNSVLDATDPGKQPYRGYFAREDFKPVEEKLNPPVWTLDVASAKIPSGKANGTISGSPF